MGDVNRPGTTVRPLASRPLGLQLFASAQDEPRSRRPTDVVLAIGTALLVVAAAVASRLLTELESSFSELVAEVPGFFDIVWRSMFWVAVAWSIVLVAVAVVRGRLALARDLVLATLIALVGAAAAAAIVMDDGTSVVDVLIDVDGPPVFPPGLLVAAIAVMSTASPHVSRPFRSLGQWLITFQLIGAVLLGAALPSSAAAALGMGLLAAAIVHLVVGSPGGHPTVSRIRLALADLGIDVEDLAPAAMQPEGVILFEGSDDEGPLLVKVYGRDAGDAQLLATLWRRLWYRGSERAVRHGRIELVEHEGFMTLLAERAGANVCRLVTAGSAGRGDALVVVRPIGETLASRTANPRLFGTTDRIAVSELWSEVQRLHAAGIMHRRLDLDRLVVTSDGSLAFCDLSSATAAGTPDDATLDLAQLLALSILLLGEDTGVGVARELGDDTIISTLPFVQDAAMPPLIRAALAHSKIDLDDVRTRLATAAGADEQPLIRLRRVTWSSLLNAALLGFAAVALIGLLGDLDLESFVESLGDANWWWLALALVMAQIPRIPAAVSTLGAIEKPLPLGPLTTLQFAISYVNLAVPSTAARVAVNIRFFQRFGVDATTAASAGAIDSVSGFMVQILLFLGLFLWSDADLGLSFDTGELDGLATIALVVVGALVVLVVLLMALPSWRQRAVDMWHKVRDATMVLRSPDQGAGALRREPPQSGALRRRPGGLCPGVRPGAPAHHARAHQHRGVIVRRPPSGAGRDGRLRSRTDTRPLQRRRPRGARLRHRPRLPLRQLLPATDLGLLLLRVAREAPLPLNPAPLQGLPANHTEHVMRPPQDAGWLILRRIVADPSARSGGSSC